MGASPMMEEPQTFSDAEINGVTAPKVVASSPSGGVTIEVLPRETPAEQATFSDAEVNAPATPASSGEHVSQRLGFEQGFEKPYGKIDEWLQGLGDKLGLGPADWVKTAAHNLQAGQAGADAQEPWRATATPGKVGEAVGGALGTLPAILDAAPLVGGGIYGALNGDGKGVTGLAMDTGLGAAFGKAGDMLVSGVSGLLKPVVAPAVKALLDANIPLTVGQIAGGTLKRVEDAATSIPALGDMIKNAQHRGIEGLNLAVANRALAPIGETVPAGVAAGREAIAHAGDTLSDRYNALLPSLTIHADPQFGQDLQSLSSSLSNLPAEHANLLEKFIKQNVLDKFDLKTGIMSGEAMKDAETALTQRIARYRKSPMPADQDMADGMETMRLSLRDLVARTNPQAATELSSLNKGWANLAIGEDAASRLGADDGMITPSQLASAVRSANNTVRKRGYARGEALMQDLSDAAKDRLPSKVPDSGSPLRHVVELGVGAGVAKEAAMPAVGHAMTVGALLGAPYTKPGAAALQALLTKPRPAPVETVGDLMKYLRLPARVIAPAGAIEARNQAGK